MLPTIIQVRSLTFLEVNLNILLLDISGNENLKESVESFFNDRPVRVQSVADAHLFKILARKPKQYAMAIALVNSENSHLVKGKLDVPTFVFQPHTYKYKKLNRFYLENGGGNG